MTNWYDMHSFPRLALSSDSELPPLSVIALDTITLVIAKGEDTIDYLQGQLTCDLVSMDKINSTLSAHCDAKGMVWSTLRLFHHEGGIAFTQPTLIAERQLTELKKYAIFSKVSFEISDQVLLGVVGNKADQTMFSLYMGNGNVRATQTGTVVRIERNRWLLAIGASEAGHLLDKLEKHAILSDAAFWDLLELRAAIPSLTDVTTNKFIPQSLNLQILGAISFKKGCYTGQEMIARAKYRGINKRTTYLLQGEANFSPKAGGVMERSVRGNWRSGGTILSGYRFDDGQALALVVLPNNLNEDTQFRLVDTTAIWNKLPLPYSLT
ncbi:tRNA-modifying protein YgfZ [Candidatus Enterovibrio escicola]|uniref:Folate-dependent protein for Fe/S cluster synthesis/repair in oxidative stress n=1 Tax=Candidatus Enterovibrio escicola TaxID=1927127 RepID=A0A2A5T6L9_9GAMM|nr:tRNA-modifying protein YgfZ [Candidatus Enterovibrio escacola]PCS23803.1 Folate-dependent protein for Fe/S cluster synthesis/repair in oxidative stress [Candidatus Enterovibrio escacola]